MSIEDVEYKVATLQNQVNNLEKRLKEVENVGSGFQRVLKRKLDGHITGLIEEELNRRGLTE